MPAPVATRDQVLSRVHTQLVKDAVASTGKGGVLSKAEQTKLEGSSVLIDAARDMRRASNDKGVIRLDSWIDTASQKISGALDSVDKPGRGHGKISLVEAREAVASKGDAGFRIGRAFELITGASLETQGAASPELTAKVAKLITDKGFYVVSELRDDSPSAWVGKKIEDQLTKWGADGVNVNGKIKLDDGAIVHVATGSVSMRNSMREVIGFFDSEGRVIGRAQIDRNQNSFELTMKSVSLGGKAGAVVGNVGGAAVAAPDKAFVDALTAELQPKWENGDDLGKDMKRADLPAAVLASYDFAARNTPDGVGLSKIEFQGQTAYAIHDYSCVTSVAIFSDTGKKLIDFVE